MGGCRSTNRDDEVDDSEDDLFDQDLEIITILNDEQDAEQEQIRVGKGNPLLGYKADYNLYPPSNVIQRVM